MTSRRPNEPPKEPGGPTVDPMLEVREKARGRRPGDAYIRIVRPFEEEFEHGDEGQLIASEKTIDTTGPVSRWFRGVRSFLFGRPISSEHEEHERLTKVKALAIFSSDNISSSAYGPEEIMRVLALAGLAVMSAWTVTLAGLIIVMLAIVTVSYRQTIKAYPKGASSYLVAGDNLGDTMGILAASALLIGYIVTVAVSISAGVAAMTSILPVLYDYRVPIGVAAIALLTVGNLRGIRESGTIFMAPTYLYIVVILAVVGWGLFQSATGTLAPYTPPPEWLEPETGVQALTLLLLLRAFSQGAVALTGVEAVSDGVPAFKPPEWKNARTTLTWAAAIFGVLFLGIAYLSATIGLVPDPNEQQTVLSQLVRQVAGDGWILVLAQVATSLLLILAANTSFADFPRLSSFLARDGFLPRQFAFRGDRLAFTTGIVALAGLAVVLLVLFNASVAGLIPLYTLGVFIAFTLSQGGMLRRWWTRREPGWQRGLVINGLGAATTAVVALVVGVSNFTSGAWLVIVLTPLMMLMLTGIRRHYRSFDEALRTDLAATSTVSTAEPIVIVPIARLDRPALGALTFARKLSDRATAIHVTNDAADAGALREQWTALGNGMELVVVESPYRALMGPLLRYMDALQSQDPSRPVVVVLSEIVPRHWWENFLHNQSSLRLKLRLFGRRNTIVVDVPYHLD
ncbi:MAG TPA: APC family permease [Candidatus Limnocylindria bacterium]|nr:APC family permease [Candidatus Limnocylindria bacterium]